jgi:hypothetical protein
LGLEPPSSRSTRSPRLRISRASRESGAGTRAEVTDEYVVEAYGKPSSSLPERTNSWSYSTPISRPTAASASSSWRIPTDSSSVGSRSKTWSRPRRDPPATGPSRQLLRLLPRFRGERADLQPVEPGSKVVYALRYAALIAVGPGKSHQSLREVSLLAALSSMTIVQPGIAEETARSSAGRSRKRRRASRCAWQSGRRRGASSFQPDTRRTFGRGACCARRRMRFSPRTDLCSSTRCPGLRTPGRER